MSFSCWIQFVLIASAHGHFREETTYPTYTSSNLHGGVSASVTAAGQVEIRGTDRTEEPSGFTENKTCTELSKRVFDFDDPMCGRQHFGFDELTSAFRVEQKFWSEAGVSNPWWAVLTGEQKSQDIPLDKKLAFYASGMEWIDTMKSALTEHNAMPTTLGRALDFGCGLGRMSQGLVRMGFQEVLCVDQAESMLTMAKKSLQELAGNGAILKDVMDHISFVKSDPELNCVVKPGTVDFVHSVITLQHTKPQLQIAYIEQMCDALKLNGTGYFGIPVKIFHADPSKRCNMTNELHGAMAMHYTEEQEVVRHLNVRGCSIADIAYIDDIGEKFGIAKRFAFRKTSTSPH